MNENKKEALLLIKEKIMNKTVLITGATSGIGLGCARKFAKNGDRLILTGRNEERVNNAGLALGLEPEQEGDPDDWDTMIDTNIKGLLTMTRLVVPGMVKRNRGHIINIGSIAGDAAYAGGNVYCATKAAVKAITDGLRIDVAETAVRVTNLKPGLVETNFSNVRFHGDTDRAAKVYQGIKPLTGDDIADVAVYVANAPEHVQIAEVTILATHQASGSVIKRT